MSVAGRSCPWRPAQMSQRFVIVLRESNSSPILTIPDNVHIVTEFEDEKPPARGTETAEDHVIGRPFSRIPD